MIVKLYALFLLLIWQQIKLLLEH